MPVIVIMIAVALVLILQKVIYQKYWNKGLRATVSFADHYMEEGQTTTVTEELSNHKILPLPWVQVKFQALRNGTGANVNRSDLYNILFHQKITRRSPLHIEERGVYTVPAISVMSYDLLISRKFIADVPNQALITVFPKPLGDDETQIPFQRLMGEVVTRRFTTQDQYQFKGIREYQPSDPMKNINFMASAKASAGDVKWLVNTHEYTLDQSVHVLLLADKGSNYFDPVLYEKALRYAAGVAARFERAGIPVRFSTNAIDAIDGSEPESTSGCSEGHIDAVLELLARVDLEKVGTSGIEILDRYADQMEPEDFLFIVCPDIADDMLRAYEKITAYTSACVIVCPVRMGARDLLPAEQLERTRDLPAFYLYEV